MLVGELLLVQTEDGELLLLAADPEAHQSLATVPVSGRQVVEHLCPGR